LDTQCGSDETWLAQCHHGHRPDTNHKKFSHHLWMLASQFVSCPALLNEKEMTRAKIQVGVAPRSLSQAVGHLVTKRKFLALHEN
jgi:hypothetical protein